MSFISDVSDLWWSVGRVLMGDSGVGEESDGVEEVEALEEGRFTEPGRDLRAGIARNCLLV